MQAKLISEPTDLVWALRAFDSDLKKEVFKEIGSEWLTMEEIGEKFGSEGKKTLKFFEKVKMVETRWRMPDKGSPKKEYHAHYSTFSIRIFCPIYRLSEVFGIATMKDEEFQKIEEDIYDWIGDGELGREVEKHFGISTTELDGIVKRSNKLEYKGMRLERVKES